jgi:predicted Zn-dependent protease
MSNLVPIGREPPEPVRAWLSGKLSLAELRGYTPEERAAVARAGLVFYQQGRLPESRALFAGLCAVAPDDAYAARVLGVIEMAMGDPDGALLVLDRAITLEPEEGAAFAGRAEVYLAMGRPDRARADLRDAARRLSGSDPLFRKVSELLAHLRSGRLPAQLLEETSRE